MKTYFPALDGLRFFAFLLVFLQHVSFYIGDEARNPVWKFFNDNGWVGVDFFFVLTGFLVTILLLNERAEKGNFSFKNFLVRRTIRIWPLYFLAIVVGFGVAPFVFEHILGVSVFARVEQQIRTQLFWYLTFLGNWGISFNGWGEWRMISQLWAVSVDQHFYVVWPVFLLLLRRGWTSILVGFGLIAFSVLVRWYLVAGGTPHPGIYVNTFARLDTFVWGAILAFTLFYWPKISDKLSILRSSIFQLGSILLLGGFLYFSSLSDRLAVRNGVWGYVVIAIVATFIIWWSATGKGFLVRVFNYRGFRELGKISYGLYVWHVLVLELLVFIFPRDKNSIFFALCAFALTVAVGFVSFNSFEKPFLKLKEKWG